MNQTSKLAIVTALLSLQPANADAQDPAAHVTFSPSRHIVLARGASDTLAIRFSAEDGSPVTDVDFDIRGRTDIISVRPVAGWPNTFQITGRTPGTRTYYISLRSTLTGGSRLIDSLTITVSDWPVADITVSAPEEAPYAGTTLRFGARALTTEGTVSADAVTWRSLSPSIAGATVDGVLSFVAQGLAQFRLSAGGYDEVFQVDVRENPVREIVLRPDWSDMRVGDVVQFEITALDASGRQVTDAAVSLANSGVDSAGATIFVDGAFVAEHPGSYEVTATTGSVVARAIVTARPRGGRDRVRLVGRGPLSDVATSDLWVFTGGDGRDYAYTGTMPTNGGQRMYVWDVTDPANVLLVDSIRIDARRVNDVKVNGDASWAIITGEQSSTRRNGIHVLALEDPAHPRVIAHLTEGMTGGIHNVWINGDVVYAVNDGTLAMDIVDLSVPSRPRIVGSWELRPGDTDKYLHDVWSDGRYAYLSYWDDGVVILDVGAGTHGGTPTNPTFVSSYSYPSGSTHVAFREGRYLFVGDEIFGCDECINGPRGYIHVLDVSNIEEPVEVARYEVPEAGSHNIWVENATLYVAYYQGGLRVVDVSGELRGDLYRQGREIGWYHTAAEPYEALTPFAANAWGPQPFKGNIFVSDLNSGLWVLHHERSERLSP